MMRLLRDHGGLQVLAAAFLALVAVALIGVLLLETATLENPIVVAHLRVDIGTVTAVAVLLFALLGLLFFLVTRYWAGYWTHQLDERLLAEQEREASQHRRFIQRLDHQLKNPLTAIKVNLDNLQQMAPGANGTWRASFDTIQAQTERLSRLARDLRKLSDLNTLAIERAPVDLGEVIEEVVSILDGLPGHHGKHIRVDMQDQPWRVEPVQGDLDLLIVAFHNLIDNALKYSSSDSTVRVRLTEDGRSAIVDVIDTGMGISADALPQIFEELYRAPETSGITGSGLGLPIVKKIVDLHGGEINVRTRQGQGTIFTVRLPLA